MEREPDVRIEPRSAATGNGSPPLSVLIRELADETRDLLRNEVTLAKLEVKETTTSIVRDTARIAIACALAAVGGLALTAFLVLVIGNLLAGAYWAGALIVGGLFALVGALLAYSGVRDLKRQHLAPDDTLETLREDKRWASREANDFKGELTA